MFGGDSILCMYSCERHCLFLNFLELFFVRHFRFDVLARLFLLKKFNIPMPYGVVRTH